MAEGLVIPEKAIKVVSGRALPKPGDDQNTEKIAPGRFLKETTFSNMGKYAFLDERFPYEDDPKRPDPEHPFNNPDYNGAKILIAKGGGFGSGSSREHAPQAIKRYGIAGVIAESIADIFAKNSQNIGLVCVTVGPVAASKLTELAQANPLAEFAIDLENKVVRYDSKTVVLEIPEGRRQAFLTGTWDALAVLMHHDKGIAAAEARIPYLKFR